MGKLMPADVTAALLIKSVQAYGEEKSKNMSRARLSRRTFLKVSGRKRIREAFFEEVRAHASDFGWALIEIDDGFALLDTDSARGWTQVSASRVRSERKAYAAGELTADELFDELLTEDIDDELED